MSIEFHFGTHTSTSDPKRPLWVQVDETVELVRTMRDVGTFARISFQHHWLSHPTVWIEPLPLIARLAPETGQMRLLTSVLKLPLHNPVDIAHQVATLDHISHGRLDFGIGIGYQESELEAAGATRKERVSRLQESLDLMKQLWTGEEISMRGRYWSVTRGRMGYVPLQEPHPPIFYAAQSIPGARRAARLADVMLMAPYVTWEGLRVMAREYNEELSRLGKTGRVGANRTLCVHRDHKEAIRLARIAADYHTDSHTAWRMEESQVLDLVLNRDQDPMTYSVVGTPQECVEIIQRQQEELDLRYMGFGFLNMPVGDISAMREYVQFVSEEVLSKVDYVAPPRVQEQRPR